jgi:type IV pilus assembly protein PilY1
MASGVALAQSTTTTELANAPLSFGSKAPPTVAFVVDDSTSMRITTMPEYVTTGSSGRQDSPSDYACTGAPKNTSTYGPKGCVIPPISNLTTEYFKHSDKSLDQRTSEFFMHGQPPLLASAYNKLAYDPLITYYAPAGYPDQTDFSNVMWRGNGIADDATGAWRPPFINLKTYTYNYDTKYPDHAKFQEVIDRFLGGTQQPEEYFDKNLKQVPAHFYRTAVRWCQYRTDKYSACQEDRDSTHTYPYFYSHLGDCNGNTDNTQTRPFEMVVLYYEDGSDRWAPKEHVYQYCDRKTKTIKEVKRTRQQELVNYANWAAYYRNRGAAVRAATSVALDKVCDSSDPQSDCYGLPTMRIFLDTVHHLAMPTSNNVSVLQGVNNPEEFKGQYKKNFLNALSKVELATYTGGTPLIQSAREIGKRFQKDKNIFKYSCQRNYHITYSDGEATDSPWTPDKYDDSVVGSLPEAVTVYGTRVFAGGKWPKPIRGTVLGGETLADVALRYWQTDLLGNSAGKVSPIEGDPATWVHLNYIALGFGTTGALPDKDQKKTLQEIMSGKRNWPSFTFDFGSSVNPATQEKDRPARVDDMWHATVNGFGRYVSAQSPDEFRLGLEGILEEITSVGKGNASLTYSRNNLVLKDQFVYIPSFTGDWTGNVERYGVDQVGNIFDLNESGGKLLPGETPQKTAQDKLNAVQWDKRAIFTADENGKTFEFEWKNLTQAQKNALGSESMVNYLRGDQTKEGSGTGEYRERSGLLGDIVNASPKVVSEPFCDEYEMPDGKGKTKKVLYCSPDEKDNPGYESFYKSQQNRTSMVYVAANDGMLHAFDQDLNEKWAYIPSVLLRAKDKRGLANLAAQKKTMTDAFQHYYYVDATPRTWDVRFDNGTWHSVLIGGLGKGGTMYYALDVTDGAKGAPLGKLMWEFNNGSANNSHDMGYSYGQPIIAMTNASGSDWTYEETITQSDGSSAKITRQRWMAILSSGYNNGNGKDSASKDIGVTAGDGKGRLYFVDIQTGKLLKSLATPEGTPTSPIELVHIDGYVENEGYQVTTAIYGADSQGNLWRFNIKDPNPNLWTVTKLGLLKDKNKKAQYVTTTPMIFIANDKRYVAIGTGGYRNNKELRDSSMLNTFYVFQDGTREDVGTDTLVTRQDMEAVDYSTPDAKITGNGKGWYMDVPAPYHFNVLSTAYRSVVVFAANKSNLTMNPTDQELCMGGMNQESMVFARDVATGNSKFLSGGSVVPFVEPGNAILSLDLLLGGRKRDANGNYINSISVMGNGVKLGELEVGMDSSGNGSGGGIPARVNIRYITDFQTP